jgi:predicted transcriptional regulator
MTADKYIAVTIIGRTQRMGNPVALRADILELLTRDGAMSKRNVINALCAGQHLTGTALETLRAAGEVEKYRAMSVRNRMDELWCIAGQSPVQTRTQFRGADTLAALQRATAASLGIRALLEQQP